ncbi:MAG: SUMF1/EgtB/PvdO family nonheme iron enzyme [Bacteroidetes bacterium]|nr:SUMF1/EgtB/PvdO family nonheme iron enzyme [Bacteroidota bacterium]
MPILPKIFIAYAHEDKPLLQKLRTHLNVMKRQQHCEIFFDGEIMPGETWDKRLKDELHTAHIFVLLVTAEFLDSDYVNETELPKILERRSKGEAEVVAVILKDCLWDLTELQHLQVVLHDGKPIEERSAYAHAAREVFRVIEGRNEKLKKESEVAAQRLEAQRRAAEREKRWKAAEAQKHKEAGHQRQAIEPKIDKRLVKVAQELKVSTSTIVDFLSGKGFHIENKPTSKVTEEMEVLLLKEFQKDIAIKKKANTIANEQIKEDGQHIKRRYDGLISAIEKMEQSIGRDKNDLDFQRHKIDTTDGQLEAQIRQAKIVMIEERLSSKEEKLAEMNVTKEGLEKRLDGPAKHNATKIDKRLVKVAQELNVGTSTIVDFLSGKGFQIENKPTSKVTEEMEVLLLKEFQKGITDFSFSVKEKADAIVEGKAQKQKEEAERQHHRSLDPFYNSMIPIKGGIFKMGEKYDVTIKDFHLCKHPVTQAQWRATMGGDPPVLRFKGCDDCPVVRVNWDDIQEFIKKLNEKTGRSYRLPSEAEWEFAGRGGVQSKNYQFSGSNTIDEVAWYSVNSNQKTQPVMQKKANELGLYDMSGNVWEWCQDIWHDNLEEVPKNGIAWTTGGTKDIRVVSGGSWSSSSVNCRSTFRDGLDVDTRSYLIGFRLAL